MREMRMWLLFVLAAIVVTAGSGFAQTPWLVPPPFEVQRDVFWDFDSGPDYPPVYYGPDDPYLKDSDFVKWESLTLAQGVVGVDNIDGNSWVFAHILFHLDNWHNNRPAKLIWLQTDVFASTAGPDQVNIIPRIFGPGGEVPWNLERLVEYPDGTVTAVISASIRPNPEWEEIVFQFEAAPGAIAWIDNLRVATACVVPEPSLLGLVGLGVVGVLARRKR